MTHHPHPGRATCLFAARFQRGKTRGAMTAAPSRQSGRSPVPSVRPADVAIRPGVWASRAPGLAVSRNEQVSPGEVLAALRAELIARGAPTVGMTITRWRGNLTLADGSCVG